MTDVTLIDPFAEWSMLDDGSVIFILTDGTNTYRLKYTSVNPLGQLHMAFGDAARTRSIFDEHGFEAALEYVSEVLNGPETVDDDSLSDDDITRLLNGDDDDG